MDTVSLPAGHEVTGDLPLYGAVEPLSPDQHAALALATGAADFAFAAASPTLHVTVDEFERAMMDYPIIFYGPRRRAVIVTGLAADRNLFVAADGRYAPGAYIPAYLRRHPFVLATASDSEATSAADRLVVCLDTGSDRLRELGTPGSTALFEDGRPSQAARDAIDFARGYHDAERRTEAFTALLDEFDLLEPRQASFRADGSEDAVRLLDYAAVSRAKLDALDRDQFDALRAAGALAPIYAHLFSEARWDVLPIWAG